MNKHIKRCMSYALGIILALGVGFSYAYAVGANDSNAFVTKTEWNTKVAQIEASLDNVNKTILDANMDFVMNGPRLQASLVEGFENSGGQGNTGHPMGFRNEHPQWNSWCNRFLQASHISLSDQWNGLQGVNRNNYYGGDMTGSDYTCKMRFALKSKEDPNIYLVFSYYYADTALYLATIYYFDISKPIQNYSAAKTVSVTLPKSNFMRFNGQILSISKTSSYLYTTAGIDYMQYRGHIYSGNNNSTYGKVTNPATGYVTVVATDTEATFTFEFPATTGGMKLDGNNQAVAICPYNLNGKKFGNAGDIIDVRVGGTVPGVVYKVYSPQKKCLALKSYMNGEIPIFNE